MFAWFTALFSILSLTFPSSYGAELCAHLASDAAPCPSATAIYFTGDVMLGRHVETLTERHGAGYPFAHIVDTLRGADAVVGNFEGTLDVPHRQTQNGSFSLRFPPESPLSLARSGFTAVSLANNHAYDAGGRAAVRTRALLARAGVVPFGDAADHTASPLYSIGSEDTMLIVYGINDVPAGRHRVEAVDRLRSIRARYPNAYIVAYPHWGTEYQGTSSAGERDFAHNMIDAGADAVVGSHPHVVQEVEMYRGKPIFYSLGNFVFDQYFSRQVQEGLLLRLDLSRDWAMWRVIPVRSDRSRPHVMDKDGASAMMRGLFERSRGVPATLYGGYIAVSRTLHD